jgi:hypothetical protein
MKSARTLLVNVLGVTTIGLMAYGVVTIVTSGEFGVPELTFLMFSSFVLTTLFSMGMK